MRDELNEEPLPSTSLNRRTRFHGRAPRRIVSPEPEGLDGAEDDSEPRYSTQAAEPFANIETTPVHTPRSGYPRSDSRSRSQSPTPSTSKRHRKNEGGSGSRGRLCARDLDCLARAVLKIAIRHYRCQLSTLNPWPDELDEQKMALDCWRRACDEKGVELEFTEETLILITRRGSQLRGELKTKMRPILETLFKLEAPSTREERVQLRMYVTQLKDHTLYIYKDPDSRRGAYEHPFIQKTINTMWCSTHNYCPHYHGGRKYLR